MERRWDDCLRRLVEHISGVSGWRAPSPLPVPKGAIVTYPQFLPDGDHFLFTGSGVLYLGALSGGEPRPVKGSAANFAQLLAPDRLVYRHDGELRAQRLDVQRAEMVGTPEKLADNVAYSSHLGRAGFAVSRSGTVAYRTGGFVKQLAWFDRTGKLLGKAGEPDPGSLVSATVSPDGSRIALDRMVQGNRDIWMMDSSRGSLARVSDNPQEDGTPVWSPDGERLAYESMVNGTFALHVRSLSGSGRDAQLQTAALHQWPLDWSRDGRYLLYIESPNYLKGDLFALPMTGADRKPIPIATTPFAEVGGSFSPDGRWVAYQTDRSGRPEIVVQPFPDPSRGVTQVSVGGGASVRWSRDGRALFFLAPDGKMMTTTIEATATGFRPGIPTPLFQTAAGYWFGIAQFDLNPEGHFLIDMGQPAPPIRLLLNWKPRAIN